MYQRYLTSFDALSAGLVALEADALRASCQVLATAHDRSRSQIVVFVAELPATTVSAILRAWLDDAWPAQSAAWWVLAYLERLVPPKAIPLRETLQPFERFARIEHDAVAIQAAAWLYSFATVDSRAVEHVGRPVEEALRRWMDAESIALSLAALQSLLRLGLDVGKGEAARVIGQASMKGFREADVLGVRCGFIECAERLVDEIAQEGPWTSMAVEALSQVLPGSARQRLETMRPSRWTNSDSAIHSSTILASHGDTRALTWLEKACQQRDARRRALAWSGRVRAVCRAGDEPARQQVGQKLLREDEAIRAWVISGLDPSCPTQRHWLDQARRYGTLEEKEAVVDAMRSFALRGPLIPDAGRTTPS